jgi:hypothetical protein
MLLHSSRLGPRTIEAFPLMSIFSLCDAQTHAA